MASSARRSSLSGAAGRGGVAAAPGIGSAKRPAAAAKPAAKKRPALSDVTNKVDAAGSRLAAIAAARGCSVTSASTLKQCSVMNVRSSSAPRSSIAKSESLRLTAEKQRKGSEQLTNVPSQPYATIGHTVRSTQKGSSITSASSSNQRTVVSTCSTSARRSSATNSDTLRQAERRRIVSDQSANATSHHATSAFLPPCSSIAQPADSGDTLSQAESMSICGSMKSPEVEYIDDADSDLVASLERRACENLLISEDLKPAGNKWAQEVPIAMDVDAVEDVDNNFDDPQLCAALASDIYKHLRAAEINRRPSTDYMERVQKDVNPSMRAILVDWLVEVAEEYRLAPDTLFLTINYIDRYLSGNEMNRQRLQLLGVSCMLIAAKYEEICAPQVEEFCYITDNTYFKDEVLQMEATVLDYLKFEVTAPTTKCFLRRFVRAAQVCDEGSPLQLEFMANFVSELSLLEYNLLRYPPSLVAASAVFLAKFILLSSKHPWNATLTHYTLYKPSELAECVRSLHRLVCHGSESNLPAIREKYSQHKYKFVAKVHCPPSIPAEFFKETAN